MARFDNAINLADRLIRKNGRPVTILRKVAGTPVDVTKPWLGDVPGSGDQTTTTVAVFLNEELLQAFLRFASGRETPVRSNMEELTVDCMIPAKGLAFDIDTSMKIVVEGEEREILTALPLQPNNQTIFYLVKLKA
jgi:hypothetical protein